MQKLLPAEVRKTTKWRAWWIVDNRDCHRVIDRELLNNIYLILNVIICIDAVKCSEHKLEQPCLKGLKYEQNIPTKFNTKFAYYVMIMVRVGLWDQKAKKSRQNNTIIINKQQNDARGKREDIQKQLHTNFAQSHYTV